MSGLKGNLRSLARFSENLRGLPLVLGQRIAAKVAAPLTALARATFDASENPYGEPWAPGANGQTITLKKTEALARLNRYVAIGTKLRVALGVRYAKYQIGKRLVFPRQGAGLPESWRQLLANTTQEEARAYLKEGT